MTKPKILSLYSALSDKCSDSAFLFHKSARNDRCRRSCIEHNRHSQLDNEGSRAPRMWTFNPIESRSDLFLQADKGTEVAIEACNECVNPGNIAFSGSSCTACQVAHTLQDQIHGATKALFATEGKERQKYQARDRVKFQRGDEMVVPLSWTAPRLCRKSV